MTWRPRRPRSARPAFLTLWLAVSLSGCSGGAAHPPALPGGRPLAVLARRIAAEGPCAQRRDIALLQRRAVALVNTRRVPAELQDPLMSGVNALAADSPPCLPPTPAPAPPPPAEHGHGNGNGHKPHDHGHGHGHGEGD